MTEQHDVRLEQLENRVRDLEAEVRTLRPAEPLRTPPPPPLQTDHTQPPPPLAAMSPIAARPDAPRASLATTVERLELDSEVVLKWGGVGLVVLAVGFALSTAIQRGWIGLELQLLGALSVGSALIWGGFHVRPTRPNWTHALCTGGILVFYTTFASYLFEDYAGQGVGIIACALVAAGGYALARYIDSEWVAAATLPAGLIAGLVLEVPEWSDVVGVGWGFGIGVVAIALAIERRWFGLRLLAFALAGLWLFGMSNQVDGNGAFVAIGAVVLLGLASLTVPSIGDLKTAWQQLEVQATALLGPWLLVCIGIATELDTEDAWGVLALSIAALVASAALLLRPHLKSAHAMALLISVSVSVSIGLALVFSAEFAVLAIALQGVGLLLLRPHLDNSVRVLVNALVLLAFSALWVGNTMVEYWTEDASIANDVVNLAIIVLLAVALYLLDLKDELLWGGAGIVVLLMDWLGSVLVHLPQGQAAVSISWAALGIGLLVGGAHFKRPMVGAGGLAVLGVTVGKLLTVDLEAVDALWRAGLFMAIGLGFLRLGFSLPKLMGVEPKHDSEVH